MSSFPVLKNRPIDQWKVTELKDELRKRKLPIKGLKEELVRRLFDSIKSEEASDEASDESAEDIGANEAVDEGSKDVEANEAVDEGSKDVEANAPVVEDTKDVGVNEPVDQAPEEHTVSHKTTVSMTEVYQETVVLATQEITLPLPEDSSRDNVVATHESLSTEAPAEKGDEPELVDGENSTVQEGHLHTVQEGHLHTELVAEETQEVGTNETIVVGDVTSADLKSDLTSSEVKSDATEANKTDKQDKVPAPVDAQVSDADPMDTDVAAASMNNDAERIVPNNDLGNNTLTNNEECKDSELMNEDCKPIVSKSNNQVPEISPDLGSPIKCESISSDDTSNNKKNIKDNLNANNFDLELEVKPEMVKPSSGITSLGGDLQPLDDDKELVKNQLSLEDIDSTANVDEVGSPEKLNLDRSSGDESMEEDVMEIKQVESNVKSDDLRGKTKLNSEHVKEVTLPDSVVDTKEVIAEEKPSASTEKRKLQAEEPVANTEPIKRQRRWAADSGKVPERQPLSQSGFDAPKDIFQPALKRSFGRSDSTASGDSPKERIVPPSQKPATTSLRIDRFVRPFTLRAVQELLGKTGSVCSFWMDHIKTHCYVTFSSVEEATATRDAVYNLQWPPNNGNHLLAEFVDPQEVKLKLEPPAPAAVAVTAVAAPVIPISPATTPREPPSQQAQANQNAPRQATTPREQLPPPPPLMKPPTSDPGSARDKLTPTPKKPEPPVVTLDDLFRKTQSSPRIYYLPLSEEEVSAKLAAQGKAK